jgi:uncharacterized membrane protein
MIAEFFGRFHPLLVHLPIGFLVLAIVLRLIHFVRKNDAIATILPLILLLSFIISVFTCISGYLLFQSGGYEKEIAEKHQWAGLILTALTGLVYFLRNYTLAQQLGWFLIAFFLMVTGHLGGTLTHGENFLSLKPQSEKIERKQISNIQEEKAFEAVIQPILQEKCYSCHSEKKQKGKLRLDTKAFIQQGGEHPNLVLASQPLNSLLYKRLILEESDEEHMPPKGKPQLTEAEIKLMNWWIAGGANFEKKVKDIKQTTQISPLLLALQLSGKPAEEVEVPSFPSEEVAQANAKDIQALKDLGAVVTPVGLNSNYLSVNISGNKKINSTNIGLLLPLKRQLVWLKAADLKSLTNIGKTLGQLENLRILHLNGSSISDTDFASLKNLSHLQLLNVTSTNISEKGVLELKQLSALQKIFLFQTQVNKSNWNSLKTAFPKATLDSGGYIVPTFESDTVQIEYPKK